MKKEINKSTFVYQILILGLFTFLFLGAEYSYVDMISLSAKAETTVNVQNYALGVSVVGFFLFPVFHRFCKKQFYDMCLLISGAVAVFCLFLVERHISYEMTLFSGLLLFLIFGFFGSMVHYLFISILEDPRYLARTVGVSYALGILLQFINNNLINRGMAETIVLVAGFVALLMMILKVRKTYANETAPKERISLPDDTVKKRNREETVSGILFAVCVILMACIFSTLDNIVTLGYVEGFDIGQWPRLLLMCSGLAAGFVFDIRKRRFMCAMMYCVMLLSVLCIAVIKLDELFVVGLIIFYLSSGFFVVFFTAGFMEIAHRTQIPEFWAGMGRAMNNLSAVVFTGVSVELLTSGGSTTLTIVVILALFVAVSIVIAIYMTRWNEAELQAAREAVHLSSGNRLENFAECFSFTPKEQKVFECLVNTEASIQEIADGLYVSRRTCQRYITAIYEKVGVKSRMGLYQLYREGKVRSETEGK